ncbi:MAG: hypothetical protein AMS27_03270 [Bacteroides sp. SM23_62_1]|nr:MAG: hypothetical protein AMS27_03270 [Bacteroides sp. SM23_62_1]
MKPVTKRIKRTGALLFVIGNLLGQYYYNMSGWKPDLSVSFFEVLLPVENRQNFHRLTTGFTYYIRNIIICRLTTCRTFSFFPSSMLL